MTFDGVTLPADGERLRFRRKGGTLWETGRVEYVWLCLDVPNVRVRTDDGGMIGLFPHFGDEIEPVREVTP